MNFATVEEAVEIIAQGGMLIVVDDERRENEGDLVMAGSSANQESINFMAKHGRGLICLTLTEERVDELGLKMMVEANQAPYKTAFTVSIESREGVTTGISAADRAQTIQTAIAKETTPRDIVSPGHIFPLRSLPGGVLRRAGHTEASVDLARLAKVNPSGVICEVMNDDGSMARMDDLIAFGKTHNLKIFKIADLIQYRLRTERIVRCLQTSKLNTPAGEFDLRVYVSMDGAQHVALTVGIKPDEVCTTPILTRVHSEALTSDVFGDADSKQRPQLHEAMRLIQAEGRGAIIYIRQDEVFPHLSRAVAQENPIDLLNPVDCPQEKRSFRDYGTGAQIIHELGIRQIKLLTNSPRKIVGIEGYDLEVSECIPIIPINTKNAPASS